MLPALASARRRAATPLPDFPLPESAIEPPWNSYAVPNTTIPTFDGSGNTIHPSVVDMGVLWNGYRWWLADTPYPNSDARLEDPTIYGSNDRLTWHVPDGLTNPLRLWPGSGYHSDTELIYDDENDRLVCFYRYTASVISETVIYAQTSTNGSTWSAPEIVLPHHVSFSISPTIWRAGSVWRMYCFWQSNSHVVWEAADLLGPWTNVGSTSRVQPGGSSSGWHGDIIAHDGRWWSIWSNTNNAPANFLVASSLDGMLWTQPVTIMTGNAGGWDQQLYRPTIIPSTEAGFMDCWYSASSMAIAGRNRVNYVRLPMSLWPDPP